MRCWRRCCCRMRETTGGQEGRRAALGGSGSASAPRAARRADRAFLASRPSSHTPRCAEFHERLVEFPGGSTAPWQQSASEIPDPRLAALLPCCPPALNEEYPPQHPLRVGIHRRRAPL